MQRQHNLQNRQLNHSKTMSYVKERSPYYSVGKNMNFHAQKLDIHSLQVKNVRNYSYDRHGNDIYSSHIQTLNNSSHFHPSSNAIHNIQQQYHSMNHNSSNFASNSYSGKASYQSGFMQNGKGYL